MSAARKVKSYLTQTGEAIFVDPDYVHLPLIRHFNPGFRIQSVTPPAGFVPRLTKTRVTAIGLSRAGLPDADERTLRELHVKGLAGKLNGAAPGSASLLDLKEELARREFLRCTLCGHRCGVNRFVQAGKCGLKDTAYVADAFVHIGEEAVLTPSASLKLFQCGLHCAGCQAWELIHQKPDVMAARGKILDGTIWQACPDFARAATLQFVGGNPTESLYPILKALTELPHDLARKPLVWNDHGYSASMAYELLDGVVDVYLPDFKGCDACVERISRVRGYWDVATKGIIRMLCQQARIIVRILVLPGHLDCCHKPSLEWLAKHRSFLWVSLLEFIPDHRALEDPALNRRTSPTEMEEVRGHAKRLGLRDVEERPQDFWRAG